MKKKDAMANVDYIILPKIKEILNENINQNAQCSVLWDGKQNFQVKWRGIEFCVNLQQHSCSCGMWDLAGIPCSHESVLFKR